MSAPTATPKAPKAAAAPVIKTLAINDIKPYWRNPRDNREAVAKVRESIKLYGYNQLICVDKKDVIVLGHTRHLALKELGWKKAAVQVLDLTEKQAKAYRIVDNKTAEYATWTPELAMELRELELPEMQTFFEEDLAKLIDNSVGVQGAKDVSDADVAKSKKELDGRFGHGGMHKAASKEVVCPDCGKEFYVEGAGGAAS